MEIIINGNTVSGTAQELAQLIALVDTATEAATAKPKREPKPKAVMTKSEQAMANRAIQALAKLGYECKARKQGTWLWVFWSSDILTGNQTLIRIDIPRGTFWSSDILTGNQTHAEADGIYTAFWSSDILTGNQTRP